MKRWISRMRSAATALALAGTALLGLAQAAPAQAEAAIGVYRWDAPNGPNMVNLFSTWLGKEATIGIGYTPTGTWEQITASDWQMLAWSTWVKAKAGRQFVYSVALLPGPASGSGPDKIWGNADDVSLAACAAGTYDWRWRAFANKLASYGLKSNTIIRLGWEFDGNWFAWGARGKEATFAACFRRVVTAMRAAQPTAGFRFDWNASEDIAHWTDWQFQSTYPGDAYVDYVGIDIYDTGWVPNAYPYPATCDAACRLARQQTAWAGVSRGLNRIKNFALSRNKPVSLPEWGLWLRPDGYGGGDNPYFIEQMSAFIKNPANKVAYHAYFDVNPGSDSHQISTVSGSGNVVGSQGFANVTRMPNAAARFKQLFGAVTAAPEIKFTLAGVTLSSTSLARGQSLTVTGRVQAQGPARINIVYEVRSTDPANTTRLTRQFVNQPFTLNELRTFTGAIALPTTMPAGTYRVNVSLTNTAWTKTLVYYAGPTFTVR
ncbi:glycosyl hydrolase [Zavarzinia sp. CC-PAN008]|uniref:glycosyl hydrolase n=1 Tax=Zavarzinia sp. CC-PAN008 TaxID=3243332 RepID=UPI003F747BFA